jgi:hypothetical protein
LNNFLHVACNYHYLGWLFTWKYLKKGFEGKSIFTSEVYTVFKVEYFLCIIQIMLQYTPSYQDVKTYTFDKLRVIEI